MSFHDEVIEAIDNNEEGTEHKKGGSMSSYSPEFERLARGEYVHADEAEELEDREETNEGEDETATEKLRKMSRRDKSKPFHYGDEFKRVSKEAEDRRDRSRVRGNDQKSIFSNTHPDFQKFQKDPGRIIDE